MNNLVSRDPIQRFKNGKKIEKFQAGGQPWAGYYTVGNWPRNEVTPRRKSSGTSAAVAQGAYNKRVAANPELLNQSMNLVGPQFVPAWQPQGVNNQMPQDGSYYEKTVDGKIVERGRWLNGKQVPLSANETIDGGNLPEVVVVGQDKSKQTPKTNTTIQQQKASPAASTNKGGISFKNAFNQARNSKQQEFTWNGKKYNTMKAGETKEQWLANLNPEKQPVAQKLELPTAILPISTPNMSASIPNVEVPQYFNFNRSQVRQLMRNQGYNPYDFTGAQRKALRMYLAGKSTNTSKLAGIDLSKFKF